MTQAPRHILLSAMKDEGPFVLEFVAHHRVLGFDAIHIASNDCTDGTDLLLDALAAQGIVTHTQNAVTTGDIPQHRGYQRMRKRQRTDEADWIMVLDADELLYVAVGAGRVADLTALAGPEIDVIALSSLNFGTGAEMEWRPGRVAEQFTRRLPVEDPHNKPVKCISRGQGRWRRMHNHHPVGYLLGPEVTYMRGNGEVDHFPAGDKVWNHLRSFPPEKITHQLAWYNHYPIKSIDSFMMRRRRGRGARAIGDLTANIRHTEQYWTRFAAAKIEDRRILDRYGAETEAEMARLLALPGIAAAQAETERRYAALVAQIADDPDA